MTTPTARPCCTEFDRLSLSRRRFLTTAAAGAGVATVGTMFADSYRQVAYGAETGNNVVVVLSLRGGADGLSLVVPRNVTDRQILADLRPGIAVPNASLIGGDANFGLHPKLQPLLPMWNDGRFGAVHAVGLPIPNRSHFDAMEIMEDADLGSSSRVGWINRTIGLDSSALPEAAVQFGSTLLPTSLVGAAPALGAWGVGNLTLIGHDGGNAARRTSMEEMWEGQDDLLGRSVRSAVEMTRRLAPLVDAVDTNVHGALYPDGSLKDVLANTAALIRADVGTRMIAIDYGDWDMHVGLGEGDRDPTKGWMADHVDHFAQSLKVFFADLGAAASRVTVVTLSEFGRRLEENGDHGVDHGYGNAMLLFGAGVKGGAVRGQWPGLTELDEGDLRVTRDYRSVLWEVLSARFPEVSGKRSTIFPDFTPESIGTMV